MRAIGRLQLCCRGRASKADEQTAKQASVRYDVDEKPTAIKLAHVPELAEDECQRAGLAVHRYR